MDAAELDAVEHYIYWKTGDALRACRAVQQFQEALRLSLPGLQARVLWRASSVPDTATAAADPANPSLQGGTILEIYALPQGLGPQALLHIEAVATAALQASQGLLAGPRHHERFTAFEGLALSAVQRQ